MSKRSDGGYSGDVVAADVAGRPVLRRLRASIAVVPRVAAPSGRRVGGDIGVAGGDNRPARIIDDGRGRRVRAGRTGRAGRAGRAGRTGRLGAGVVVLRRGRGREGGGGGSVGDGARVRVGEGWVGCGGIDSVVVSDDCSCTAGLDVPHTISRIQSSDEDDEAGDGGGDVERAISTREAKRNKKGGKPRDNTASRGGTRMENEGWIVFVL